MRWTWQASLGQLPWIVQQNFFPHWYSEPCWGWNLHFFFFFFGHVFPNGLVNSFLEQCFAILDYFNTYFCLLFCWKIREVSLNIFRLSRTTQHELQPLLQRSSKSSLGSRCQVGCNHLTNKLATMLFRLYLLPAGILVIINFRLLFKQQISIWPNKNTCKHPMGMFMCARILLCTKHFPYHPCLRTVPMGLYMYHYSHFGVVFKLCPCLQIQINGF